MIQREAESDLAQDLRGRELSWIATPLDIDHRCVFTGGGCRLQHDAELAGTLQPFRWALTWLRRERNRGPNEVPETAAEPQPACLQPSAHGNALCVGAG